MVLIAYVPDIMPGMMATRLRPTLTYWSVCPMASGIVVVKLAPGLDAPMGYYSENPENSAAIAFDIH